MAAGNIEYQMLTTSNAAGIENLTLEISRSLENEKAAGLHWHSALELNYILEGTVDYYAEGVRTAAVPGDLVLANTGCIHSGSNAHPGTYCSGLIMIVPDELLHRYVPEILSPVFHIDRDSESFKRIVSCMQRLTEYVTSVPAPEFLRLRIEKELSEILFTLYTECLTGDRKGTHESALIKKIIDYTGKHFREELTVDNAAEEAGLQKNYFCRVFKNQTGISYHQYLGRLRLDAALSYLAESEMSVLEAALEAGFSTEKTLIEWCRKIHGCTPGKYTEARRRRS